jgi:transcriptional regulator with XRE-family HTH domain
MPSVQNLFKLATVLEVSPEDIYKEIGATAGKEVEEKRVSLKVENERIRRMKLRDAARIARSNNQDTNILYGDTSA